MLAQFIFGFNDILYLFKEKHIYFCGVANHAYIGLSAQEFCNRINTVVGAVLYII